MQQTDALLAADIGGTHSRFALFRLVRHQDRAHLRLEKSIVFQTKAYAGITEVVAELERTDKGKAFLPPSGSPERPVAAVLAIPGPAAVSSPSESADREEEVQLPNVRWPISWREAASALGIPTVRLINDFVAQGFACAAVPEILETEEIIPGVSREGAPIALVGAGTGLGQCLIFPWSVPFIQPSEGGHTPYPFLNEEEAAFGRVLARAAGTEVAERDHILSGTGVAALYHHMTGLTLSHHEATARLARGLPEDAGILEAYARFYARACRDFVIMSLARGGLFITGGMASRLPAALRHPEFLREFHNMQSVRHILEQVPVRHVCNQAAGLWGAAVFAALSLYGELNLQAEEHR